MKEHAHKLFKSYLWHFPLGRGKERRPIPSVIFEILGLVYKLWSTLTRKGDFMAVWAQKT